MLLTRSRFTVSSERMVRSTSAGELLTAARHTPDLVPDGRTYVHLDAAHHGIGSGSCGPPVQAGHSLAAHPVDLVLGFSV